MKPVKKDPVRKRYSPYDAVKPYLLDALGEHCSYCERSGAPQDLHVEHIYPKGVHPNRETDWNNFLLACNTCNSCKHAHLGNRRQRALFSRYLWPHLDNTNNAFQYKDTGQVEIAPSVPNKLRPVAERTKDMVGLLASPAKATIYKQLGIAYDGASRRSQMWSIAMQFKAHYLKNPTSSYATTISEGASKMGYFSIWMQVFIDRREIRKELIRAFKADADCFDPTTTSPVAKGRL